MQKFLDKLKDKSNYKSIFRIALYYFYIPIIEGDCDSFLGGLLFEHFDMDYGVSQKNEMKWWLQC